MGLQQVHFMITESRTGAPDRSQQEAVTPEVNVGVVHYRHRHQQPLIREFIRSNKSEYMKPSPVLTLRA